MTKRICKIVRLNTQNLKTTDEIKEKISFIQNVALQLDYKISAYYPKSSKLSLEKNNTKVVVDLVNNNVVTTLQHPTYDKPTKLKRENLNLTEIGSVLFNPRSHTGKGRYVKHKKKKFWSSS